MGRTPVTPATNVSADDGGRRTEVLETAADVFATSGLRTSMHDIAEAAGIQAGSLYHHFDSKEALLTELLQRYHADLERVAERAVDALDDPATRPGYDSIVTLGTAIARAAIAHRAAIQISMYETPSSNPSLAEWTARRPTPILEAMYQTLRAARWSGYLVADTDLRVLADRICQSLLQIGLDVMRRNATPERVATLMCRVMLEGLATASVSDAAFDHSDAYVAADSAVNAWSDDTEPTDKAALVRAVARAEFGKRGYEGTTVRDIAAAAGIGHGTVFRLIGSKDELLASIMGSFGEKVDPGSRAVLESTSSPLEKLDALGWININALRRFGDEFRIQLAWMRQIPPDAPNPSIEFPTRLRQTKKLLADGMRSGTIKVDDVPQEMLARCVIGLQWVPENILRDVGARASHLLLRDTLLRGAANAG